MDKGSAAGAAPLDHKRELAPLHLRMMRYADRFEKGGKPEHAEVIRSWVQEMEKLP